MPSKPLSKKTSSSAKKNVPSSKASLSPAKKITSLIKTEMSDVDIEALVKEQLATDHSSGASPSKKRKNRPVVISSDSSDVELLEGPLLEAVSAIPTLENVMSEAGATAPAIEFGLVIINNNARPKAPSRHSLKPSPVLTPAAVRKPLSKLALPVEPTPAAADSASPVEMGNMLPDLSSNEIPDMAQYTFHFFQLASQP
ncbi:hypothetical protein BYT27DRAFT_7260509 [Phlegmacium glaucopus]|nr:hypothetical protein BYT27DRAFT_7260509 [Phlegmacium glaucopus]